MSAAQPLRAFLRAMTLLATEEADARRQQAAGAELLRALVAVPGWLPHPFNEGGPGFRQQILYGDPLERFSLIGFVWGTEESVTPVHDHGVWGAVGVLAGEEVSVEMLPDPAGGPMREGRRDRLRAGEVMLLGLDAYDIHKVENARPGEAGIAIHLYGGNIGAIDRRMFDPPTSAATLVKTGYDNPTLPNPWV
ncbi:MAG TPA: cysteine dioxygenase [Roseomonas sp.]|jgi:predicted metal-dependent enzyme (double-stranded beta helix superfamily)